MSWHYLQEQEAVSWAGACLDGAPSALLRLMPTPDRSCSHDKGTGVLTRSRSGMTSAPSTASHGKATLMSSAAGSPAKTSVVLERAQVLKVADQAYGARWRESLARYDRHTCSWRTAQCSLLGGSATFSETWPRWGMMRAGVCSELATLEHLTSVNGSGWQPEWATPTARDWKDSPGMTFQRPSGRMRLDLLPRQVYYIERQRNEDQVSNGMRLNPPWVAWLMGWPLGWTDCEPLATDRYQQWQHSHGKH